MNFLKSKIKYLEQIIDAKGRKPNPSRSSVIKNMPAPTKVTTLQAFLGLVNYYSNPKHARIKSSSKQIIEKNDLKWNWSTECQSAFEEIKILASDLSLMHYNQKEDIIAIDTSNSGLGAIILHKESNNRVKVIVHPSRILLPAEKGHSQIGKKGFMDNFSKKKKKKKHVP